MNLLGGGEVIAPEAICSRKGCRQPAEWDIVWRNPRIHTADRRKIWLACAEHKNWLENYLKDRDMYLETLPHREGAA